MAKVRTSRGSSALPVLVLLLLPTRLFGAWHWGPPWNYQYEPSYRGYDLMDTHPSYYGGGRYQEYYNFGIRDPGFAFPASPSRSRSGYGGGYSVGVGAGTGFGVRSGLGVGVGVGVGSPSWPTSPGAPPTAPNPTAIDAILAASSAQVTIQVPPDAEVWIEGQKMKSTGESRQFVTPRLPPNQDFVYEVSAKWPTERGPIEQIKTVVFRAGGRVTLTFQEPPQKLGEPKPLPILEAKTPVPAKP